ncbi:MAG TPA: VOC family protein [Mucilaginibacter sp.]|nr:VOC family protein [Mucilaginibacter sp.]
MANKQPTYGNGKICYVEIPATDINESADFYSKIFGWTIRTRGDGRTAFDDGIGEVSGAWILGRKPSTEPGLLISVMVDDIEETIKALEANGSKIVNRINISDTEFVAWFVDPAGNVIGLYQHPGGGHGKICYLEIPATDIDRSSTFYETVFGWPLRDKGTEHVAFDDGVGVVSGMWALGRPASPEPGLLIYMMMDSVAATVEAVIANGGQIVQPIGMDAPEITARFSDPAGNVLGLYQEPG